jgi:uncharacterized protein (TIRG00374 family)
MVAQPVAQGTHTSRRRYVWLALRLLFVSLVLAVIVSRIDLPAFMAQARLLDLRFVVLGSLVWLAALTIAAYRWKLLMDVVAPGANLISLFVFNLVGIFYAQFLPGSVTGDLVKGYYVARFETRKIDLFASVLADRFIGILANGLLGVVALMTNAVVIRALGVSESLPGFLLILTVISLIAGFGLFYLVGRWENRLPSAIAAAYRAISVYLRQPTVLVRAALVSLLFFMVWSVALWCLMFSTGMNTLDFATVVLILAVVNLAQIVPLSINGWGVREGALVILLSAFGVSAEQALLLSLLVAAVSLIVAALGGMLVLSDYRYTQKGQTSG